MTTRKTKKKTTTKRPLAPSLAELAVQDALADPDADSLRAIAQARLALNIYRDLTGRIAVTGSERSPGEIELLGVRARQYARKLAHVFFDPPTGELLPAELATQPQDAEPF